MNSYLETIAVKKTLKRRAEKKAFISLTGSREMKYIVGLGNPQCGGSGGPLEGKISCPLPRQLSQTTQLFLSGYKEQCGREQREKEEPLGQWPAALQPRTINSL